MPGSGWSFWGRHFPAAGSSSGFTGRRKCSSIPAHSPFYSANLLLTGRETGIKYAPIDHALDRSHLYLWVPNALLPWGFRVMEAWGFHYKTNLIWSKVRKDGGPDGRGVGFYFRNVTEVVLFGVRGKLRTGAAGRRQVNLFSSRKREHSRKPEECYEIIESCSPGPRLELFARAPRKGWRQWGNEVDTYRSSNSILEARCLTKP
jgi:N6-adenosine-specific RNA methylase IME4